MAKKDKASKADKAAEKETKVDKKAEKAAEREFKYGVEEIAEKLDIKPASVRVQLRNRGIEKAGKSYGWNSKADLDEVVAKLKAEKPAAEDKKAGKDKKTKGKKDEPAAEEPAAEGKKAKKDKKKNK